MTIALRIAGEPVERIATPRHLRVFTFAVCFLILMWRSSERLLRPTLWAEDGRVFLQDDLNYGWHALFLHFGGYFHTIPRLIALAVAWLNPGRAPELFLVISVMVAAWVFSSLTSHAFATVFPSAALRFFLSVALCFCTAEMEAVGNLANLHSVVFCWAVFLSFRPWPLRLSRVEWVVFALTAVTAGEIAVVLPLFLLRALACRPPTPRARTLVWAPIVIVLVGIGVALVAREPTDFVRPGFAQTLETSVHAFTFRYLFFMWAGGDATSALSLAMPLWAQCAACGTWVLIVAATLARKPTIGRLSLVLASFAFLGLVILITLVRDATHYISDQVPWFFSLRYAFPTAVGALLSWAFVFQALPSARGWIPAVAGAVLCMSVIHTTRDQLVFSPYPQADKWRERRELLNGSYFHGCPTCVQLFTAPDDGWRVRHQTSRPDPACALPATTCD